MRKQRKTWTASSSPWNPKGASFSVGSVVQFFGGASSGQRGVILKILPPYPGDDALGPRAWVAMDVATRYRRFASSHPSREGMWSDELSGERAREASGTVRVHHTYLDHLKRVGQARRVPKVEFVGEKPNALAEPYGVEAMWVR